MLAKKFERCESVIEVEIHGKKYVGDFAKDEVSLMFYNLRKMLNDVEKMMQDDTSDSMQQVKDLYQRVVDTLLYDGASQEIFKDDDSISFHEDVFQYLLNEYKEYRERKSLKYSKARLLQK